MKKIILSIQILTFLSLNLFSQLPSYVSNDSIVGWWPFNNDCNDESLNNNDGVNHDAVISQDRFGNENNSYYFNGDSFIEIPSLNVNSNWSISFWYMSTDTEIFGLQYPIGVGCSSVSSWGAPGFGINGGGQQYPCMTMESDKMFFTDANTECTSNIWSSNYEREIWYHVVLIKNVNQYSIYINGQLRTTGELENIVIDDLILAKRCDFEWLQFVGNLDDIGMWNRVLTDKEIDDLYRSVDTNTTTDVNDHSNPIDFGGKVECYPNPTTDVINVDLSGLNDYSGQKLRIMNLSGQIVYEENVNQSKVVIDVKSLLSSGIYVLNTVDRNGTITSTNKFVVQ